jgi:hypothetical protein
VGDLYDLDEHDQALVIAGRERALEQFAEGRREAMDVPGLPQLGEYARAFARCMDPWLSVANEHMKPLIYEGTASSPLQVVQFERADGQRGAGGPQVDTVPLGPLRSALAELSERTSVPIGSALHARRLLRIYDADQVIFVKPNLQRHWSRGAALADADAVFNDHLGRAAAE